MPFVSIFVLEFLFYRKSPDGLNFLLILKQCNWKHFNEVICHTIVIIHYLPPLSCLGFWHLNKHSNILVLSWSLFYCYEKTSWWYQLLGRKAFNWGLLCSFRFSLLSSWQHTVRHDTKVVAEKSTLDPQTARRDRLWGWLGLLKLQSPSPVTDFLQGQHTYYSNAILLSPSK